MIFESRLHSEEICRVCVFNIYCCIFIWYTGCRQKWSNT